MGKVKQSTHVFVLTGKNLTYIGYQGWGKGKRREKMGTTPPLSYSFKMFLRIPIKGKKGNDHVQRLNRIWCYCFLVNR